MHPDHTAHKIRWFWTWFLENEYRFKDLTDVDGVVDDLDNQILAFGLFAWEIREGASRPYRFTLSPNGNAERLALSRQIMAAAPELADWEFFYCKPPREGNFHFEMYDSFMVKQQIDASEWAFVLEKKANGKTEVLLRITNMNTFDEDDKLAAADLVLTNILGEEHKINHVGSVSVVPEFAPEQRALSANLTVLSTGDFR